MFVQHWIDYILEENIVLSYSLRKRVTKYMLVLKIVDQIKPGMFYYAFTKLFLGISQSGYRIVEGLINEASLKLKAASVV